MKIKLFLTVIFMLVPVLSVFAQASGTQGAQPSGAQGSKPSGGTVAGPMPKLKVAIVDVLAFREQIGELKTKYEKLQTEFTPRYTQLESLQTKLAAQEKTLAENKTLTPQQAAKLTEEYEQGKKEYQRMLEDSQQMARKREQEETEATYDKIYKFMEQYCAKHSITTVFDARRLQETGVVVYAAPVANITADFVKEYNKAYPPKL